MTKEHQQELGKTLWGVADQLRGAMNADDFRDYMLSFLFLRYISDAYEATAKRELGAEYPIPDESDDRWWICREVTQEEQDAERAALQSKQPGMAKQEVAKALTPLGRQRVRLKTALDFLYAERHKDVATFEEVMRTGIHYVIRPEYLWSNIAEMARAQDRELLNTLQSGFKYIEHESFKSTFQGLFSEINLESDKLGKDYAARNAQLCKIITAIAKGLKEFSTDSDTLGDAYEYLIGQFASGSGKKAGEFYTPQQISSILSGIVSLDSQDPTQGVKKQLASVFDFACGSGSLLLNVRTRLGARGVGRMYGQEKNITTYNLARMNMLLHGVKDSEFAIYHGDSLENEWDMLKEPNPSKKPAFDAVVANPPFSLRWEAAEDLADDARFTGYGLAPKSAADFAFLLHGFHYLKDDGAMAIILPHGVLFRGGVEGKIRHKLIKDDHIDTVIGLPPNLFYSTGIPVCILVLKKCKRPDDVLVINASEEYEKGKRQNYLTEEHIARIIDTYQFRKEEARYSRRVAMEEIEAQDYNLNISRYISTQEPEREITLEEVRAALASLDQKMKGSTRTHNGFLNELGLDALT